MPRIPAHSPNDAPEPARQTLRELPVRLGRFNVHGQMEYAPVVQALDTGIQRPIVGHGSFNARTRERNALTTGAVDNCSYCQVAHLVVANVCKKYDLAIPHTAAPKRTRSSAPTTGVLADTHTSIEPAVVHRQRKAVTSDLPAIATSKADFVAPTNNVGS